LPDVVSQFRLNPPSLFAHSQLSPQRPACANSVTVLCITYFVRKLTNRSLLKLGFDRSRRPYLSHEIDRSGRFKTSRSQETSCHRSGPPQAADAVNQYIFPILQFFRQSGNTI